VYFVYEFNIKQTAKLLCRRMCTLTLSTHIVMSLQAAASASDAAAVNDANE